MERINQRLQMEHYSLISNLGMCTKQSIENKLRGQPWATVTRDVNLTKNLCWKTTNDDVLLSVVADNGMVLHRDRSTLLGWFELSINTEMYYQLVSWVDTVLEYVSEIESTLSDESWRWAAQNQAALIVRVFLRGSSDAKVPITIDVDMHLDSGTELREVYSEMIVEHGPLSFTAD